jgi:hypothetical protein
MTVCHVLLFLLFNVILVWKMTRTDIITLKSMLPVGTCCLYIPYLPFFFRCSGVQAWLFLPSTLFSTYTGTRDLPI